MAPPMKLLLESPRSKSILIESCWHLLHVDCAQMQLAQLQLACELCCNNI
jgi:hypothetical protein